MAEPETDQKANIQENFEILFVIAHRKPEYFRDLSAEENIDVDVHIRIGRAGDLYDIPRLSEHRFTAGVRQYIFLLIFLLTQCLPPAITDKKGG